MFDYRQGPPGPPPDGHRPHPGPGPRPNSGPPPARRPGYGVPFLVGVLTGALITPNYRPYPYYPYPYNPYNPYYY